jgi:hypothetical protein
MYDFHNIGMNSIIYNRSDKILYMDRRRYLAIGVMIGLGSIAGCTESEEEPDENESEDGADATDGDDGSDGTAYSGSGTEHYAGTWSGETVSGEWEFTVDWETG